MTHHFLDSSVSSRCCCDLVSGKARGGPDHGALCLPRCLALRVLVNFGAVAFASAGEARHFALADLHHGLRFRRWLHRALAYFRRLRAGQPETLRELIHRQWVTGRDRGRHARFRCRDGIRRHTLASGAGAAGAYVPDEHLNRDKEHDRNEAVHDGVERPVTDARTRVLGQCERDTQHEAHAGPHRALELTLRRFVQRRQADDDKAVRQQRVQVGRPPVVTRDPCHGQTVVVADDRRNGGNPRHRRADRPPCPVTGSWLLCMVRHWLCLHYAVRTRVPVAVTGTRRGLNTGLTTGRAVTDGGGGSARSVLVTRARWRAATVT